MDLRYRSGGVFECLITFVAFSAFRVNSQHPTLGEEARILRYLQGGDGIRKLEVTNMAVLYLT